MYRQTTCDVTPVHSSHLCCRRRRRSGHVSSCSPSRLGSSLCWCRCTRRPERAHTVTVAAAVPEVSPGGRTRPTGPRWAELQHQLAGGQHASSVFEHSTCSFFQLVDIIPLVAGLAGPRSMSRDQGPSTRCRGPGTGPGTRGQGPGNMDHVPGVGDLESDQGPGTRYQGP